MAPLISPAQYEVLGIPLSALSLVIPLVGISIFSYILMRRLAPLRSAADDVRSDDPKERFKRVLSLWVAQSRQLRYKTAGIIHLVIFFGFLVLAVRTISLVFVGIDNDFGIPGLPDGLTAFYTVAKDIAATAVLIACIYAAYRRGIQKPERYSVPESMGKDHTGEALFVLGLISLLMLSEALFEASAIAAGEQGHVLPLTLTWLFVTLLSGLSPSAASFLQAVHIFSYFIHDLVFFFFLCYLPFGKHFHVITSLFNVWFMRLHKGIIKPVKYGVSGDDLFELESFGVKKLEDFTWKHMLDFYSCADCGRCSDNCPANSVGRPLSPRFISIKGRDHIFRNYPLTGTFSEGSPLVGEIYQEDEIWSCTTCGACEEECPIGIEYIDKIVDLRRGMVDEGLVPQSLQPPLKALEKRGNPYGKMEKKRALWAKDDEFAGECGIKIIEKKGSVETLYFVDSITSYEDRMHDIAKATSRVLGAAGLDFGILGKKEKDSGNDVRRFGEEMLFQDLQDQNSKAIEECGAEHIVTADPHAYNTLKNEYEGLPPVSHICELALAQIQSGNIKLKETEQKEKVFTYHDPCYLGRHNGQYSAPRQLIDSIPGIRRVEMDKHSDRSYCCGGGGLMLYYEPEEETRMGIKRVQMAKETGANVIVTACPFCLVNIQDAVKTLDLDSEIEVMDIAELVADHLDLPPQTSIHEAEVGNESLEKV